MILALDFETFYDADYTLSKLSTSEYVRDPRFKIHGVGLQEDGGPTKWYTDTAILQHIDWKNVDLLCHNTAFDGFILSHHFGIVPRKYLDTLSMARAAVPMNVGHSLEALAAHFKLGTKLKRVLESTKGIRDLPAKLAAQLGFYCCHDVELTYDLWLKLRGAVPPMEVDLIDITLRMFCQPVLCVDKDLLKEAFDEEVGKKGAALMLAGVTERQVASPIEFVKLMQQQGVYVPQRPTPAGSTPAIAKTDEFLQDLLKHTNPKVRALAEARLKVKSTIVETRAERLLQSADTTLPVLLNYCGAHTTRWSGGDKMNLQNLPRESKLRPSVMAPPGYSLVVADSAQIEARVLAWLAGHEELLNKFRNKEDVYKYTASLVLGKNESLVTPDERQLGKVLRLALGFGMGAGKLQTTLRLVKMNLALSKCGDYVNAFRATNQPIVAFWSTCDTWLKYMAVSDRPFQHGVLTIARERIVLPNGLSLWYPGIDGRNYSGRKGQVTKIYNGLLCENVVQAIARCVVAEQMWHIAKKYRVVSMSHDEVICVAPKAKAETALHDMIRHMSTPPSWAKSLPIAAEGTIGERYE